MARFSQEARQAIVREFALRHNGEFNPTLFFEEVRDSGASHPAYGWFEWDTGKAALAYQIEQAREFARDLRVSFKVEEIGANRKVKVREASMPMVLSPINTRQSGGGYLLVDPEDPSYMVEHCHQAAVALRGWMNRYQSALAHVHGASEEFRQAISKLESVQPAQLEAAE